MFGRHPRLSADLAFGVDMNVKYCIHHYLNTLKQLVKQLRKHRNIRSTAMIRRSVVRGFVKILTNDSTHKIADNWENDPCLIVRQSDNRNSVSEVKKENEIGKSRILHRDSLLPISSIKMDDDKSKVPQITPTPPSRSRPKPTPRPRNQLNLHQQDENKDTESVTDVLLNQEETTAPMNSDVSLVELTEYGEKPAEVPEEDMEVYGDRR